MRVTRNYLSPLVNGNGGMDSTTSLLQRALSRSSKGRRTHRSDQLTGSKNNPFAGLVNTTQNTEKLYYNMKYHAGQVEDYAKKLTDNGEKSLFARAKENGSTSEIVANIKGFVGQYNSMMKNLKDSGSRADSTYVTQFNNIAGMNRSELAACGVTKNADGTLSVDEKKLASADIDTLAKAWGTDSGFAGRVGHWADSVESSAESSMQAQVSSAYTTFLNSYGSRGNFFNFLR